MNTTKHDLELSRVVDAPPELVWRAWSESGEIERWWGPAGWTVPVAEVDFTESGRTLVGMRAPAEYGGMTMYNTWTYSAIRPYESIEFVLHFSDANGNKLDPATQGVPAGVPDGVPHRITFEPAGEGRTRLTVTEYGYTTEEARDMSRLGLEQTLDKLVALFP